LLTLLLITAAAVLVAGYHPGVEDAEIYLPGIRKALNPEMYPHNDAFFASHSHLTLFPNLIAFSVRMTHLPLDYALLAWQVLAVFLLLLGCRRVGRLCFADERAQWGGVMLVAALLTIPVAGTALSIMDQYLNTRSLSAPLVLFAVINALERKWVRAGLWIVATGLIHPLMVVFGVSFVVGVVFLERWRPEPAPALWLLPLLPPVTDAYRETLNSRSYFFLLRWPWYEWLGIFAPLGLLWWYRRIARKQELPNLERLCTALVVFGLAWFAVALVLTVPSQFANLTLLQPMRALHLLYILLFVFTGGLLGRYVLKGQAWRWLALFVPLCCGLWYAQRQTFPATPHLELPWTSPANDWVRAFLWVRENTPQEAYFALNPEHMALPGEDQHGFRAIAGRSRLADHVKDSGAVTMFPNMAEEWRRQVRAQAGWKDFGAEDFRRLRREFGVDWVVLERPVTGLRCPYQNATVRVCRVE
jgi:hypothetical protein